MLKIRISTKSGIILYIMESTADTTIAYSYIFLKIFYTFPEKNALTVFGTNRESD